jgi:hypothetical protein
MQLKINFNLRLIAALVFISMVSCQRFKAGFDAMTGASPAMLLDGNSLFHRSDIHQLSQGKIEVAGEIKDPGMVDFAHLYKREVVVKETMLDNNGAEFVGAYRYRGYSLFDLLNSYTAQKKNSDEFRPQIDLYITIENEAGDQVVFSWSEIFHTILPHQIILATEMAPIKPYRKEVEYPLSEAWKIVAATDLYANRYLDKPVRITVSSFDKKEFPINRDLSPLYSSSVSVSDAGTPIMIIGQDATGPSLLHYETTFFGMGMGHHPSEPFDGASLRSYFAETAYLMQPDWLQKGLVCFASIDGYRAVFSFSELFNRNDHVLSILAITALPHEGGHFRNFHPVDFFADRSVKSLKEIYLFMD